MDTKWTKQIKGALIHTNDEGYEKEIEEATHLTIAQHNINYLGKTFTKVVEGLYNKKLKQLKKIFQKIS